jgi:hypothetical protein
MTRRMLLVALGLAIVMSGGVVSAAAQGGAFAVTIREGDCATPGAANANLNELPAMSEISVGSNDALPAVSAYSLVDVSLDTLLGSTFAVAVSNGDRLIACGEIGGTLDGNGALSMGLRPAEDSAFSGIAYLARSGANPAQTGVSVFLVGATGTAASAAETPEGAVVVPATPATADVEDYAAATRRHVTLVAGSLQRIDALFAEPRIGDDAWLDQVRAELALWQLLHAAAGQQTPPAGLEPFHADFLSALGLLDSAADDILAALDEGDEPRLGDAGEKIDQAIQALIALDTPEEI